MLRNDRQYKYFVSHWVNTLRPRQDGRHFPDDIFKCIFLNENIWISINVSLKFVPKGQINNIPALVQIMAWRRPGDKPLFEPMMVRLPTHICVTRPQWVNRSKDQHAMKCHLYIMINSLCPNDAILWHRSGSTLHAEMICCLLALSHYLNHRWFLICEVLWHSHTNSIKVSAQVTIIL